PPKSSRPANTPEPSSSANVTVARSRTREREIERVDLVAVLVGDVRNARRIGRDLEQQPAVVGADVSAAHQASADADALPGAVDRSAEELVLTVRPLVRAVEDGQAVRSDREVVLDLAARGEIAADPDRLGGAADRHAEELEDLVCSLVGAVDDALPVGAEPERARAGTPVQHVSAAGEPTVQLHRSPRSVDRRAEELEGSVDPPIGEIDDQRAVRRDLEREEDVGRRREPAADLHRRRAAVRGHGPELEHLVRLRVRDVDDSRAGELEGRDVAAWNERPAELQWISAAVGGHAVELPDLVDV